LQVESVEDSEEEVFLDDAKKLPGKVEREREGALKLTFSICSDKIGLDEQWP
jgi:hypothetical protein